MTFDAETIYKQLQPHFQERVRLNEPMARHCTFGVGGPADVWVSLETSGNSLTWCACASRSNGRYYWWVTVRISFLLMRVCEVLLRVLYSIITPLKIKVITQLFWWQRQE